MATAGCDSPSAYELKRLENIKRNLDFMEKCGLKVNRKAYIPPKPKKRKKKVESDSSSDEEWRPGVDEETAFNNRKKFIPDLKPKKIVVKRTPVFASKQTKTKEKIDSQDCSDFDLLGKLDESILEDEPKQKAKPVKKSIKLRNKNTVEKHSPRVIRSIRKYYKEEEVPDDDHYIFCEECQDFYHGECPSHCFKIIEDNKTAQPDAMKSLPDNLYIKNSLIPNSGSGVFTKVKLDVNTRFGPYKGKKVDSEDLDNDMNTAYMWEILQDSKIQHYLDGHDTSCSNWMRYVNCSRCENEQNLVAYQYHGEIYYRVYKPVGPNSELLVWYGDDYAELLGIPLEDEQTEDKIGGYTCKHCGRMYAYSNYLEVHSKRCPVLASGKLWECKSCRRKYSTEEYLNMHTKNDCKNGSLENNERKRTGKAYCCQYCGKGFTLKGDLKTHLRTHTGEKPYQCEHCQKGFAWGSNLKTHLRTHTGEKPYQCEHCQKGFAHGSHLETHLRTHTGEKPYQCEHCQKGFARGSDLKIHLRTHTGEKPYQCEYCQKGFAQGGHLKTHLRTHTGEKPYQCEHCQKGFAHGSHLETHLRTHTGEKPYQCEHCQKGFARGSDLKIHLRTHTGEKPYQCEHCQKGFARGSDLKIHLRTHTGEKPYQCEHCQKGFARGAALKIHLRTHTGEKPYQCEHCQKGFAQGSDLKRHLRTHTGEKPYQ